jgi:hypothetical protein
MKIPGWALVVGFLILTGSKRPRVNGVDDQAAPPRNPDDSPMADAPPTVAYLYQLPQDSFSTTRMAIGPKGSAPTFMGLFGTPDAATKLATSKGWQLAWSGVRQLTSDPGPA